MSKRIFISYGRDRHAALAERLKVDLEGLGHDVWFDKANIKAGRDWEIAIEQGLKGTDLVLAMLTPHAVRRPNGVCLDELSYERFMGKPILPLMVEECPPPLSISRIQWLDLQDWNTSADHYRRKLTQIIEVLKGHRISYEGSQARLLAELQPIDFGAELDEKARRFFGREWLFADVDAWLDDRNASRVLYLTGLPGVGKTAISAYLSTKHAGVAAFHLCSYWDKIKSSALHCVLSVAYQLSTQLLDFQDELVKRPLTEDARTNFDQLIVQPLRKCKRPSRNLFIVVDALDEATNQEHNELAELLAQSFHLTPEWLRLFITSRPEQTLLNTLAELAPRPLNASDPRNWDDIKRYLKQELSIIVGSVTEDQLNAILERSEGSFLYTAVVLDEIRIGRLSLDRPDEFPSGLRAVYKRFFQRQFSDPDVKKRLRLQKRYGRYQRPLLEIVASAQEPPSVEFLGSVLDWDKYGRKHSLDLLRSFFPERGGRLHPFHGTILEWLTDDTTDLDFVVDPMHGHKALADAGWSQYERDPFSMHPYFVHLPRHLLILQRYSELEMLLTDLRFLEFAFRVDSEITLRDEYAWLEKRLKSAPAEATRKGSDHAKFPLFAQFVRAEFQNRSICRRIPFFCTQQAFNSSIGPLRAAAQSLLVDMEQAKPVWFERLAPTLGQTSAGQHEPRMATRTLVNSQPMAISADGTRAAVARGSEFKLWHIPARRTLYTVRGDLTGDDWNERITAIAMTPCGRMLASVQWNGDISVWDLQGPHRVRCFPGEGPDGHGSEVYSVALSPDGQVVVSGGLDMHIRYLITGKCRQVKIPFGVHALAMSGDGNIVLAAGEFRRYYGISEMEGSFDIFAFDVATGSQVQRLTGHDWHVTALAASETGTRAVSSESNGTLRFWDVQQGICLRKLAELPRIEAIRITPHAEMAFAITTDGVLLAWDLIENRIVAAHSTVQNVALANDEFLLMAEGGGGLSAIRLRGRQFRGAAASLPSAVGNNLHRIAMAVESELQHRMALENELQQRRLRPWYEVGFAESGGGDMDFICKRCGAIEVITPRHGETPPVVCPACHFEG